MPIVAIGGGEIRAAQTLPIDRHIVRLSGRETPNVLFVSTASRDLGGYITTFKKYYTQQLGCRVQPLILTRGQPKTTADVSERVAWADIVYVGGGNTRFMLETWQAFGLPDILRQALARGCVLSGLSAGALCWFESGIGNSGIEDEYIELAALGMLSGCFAPHYCKPGVEARLAAAFSERMASADPADASELPSFYGVDDGAALVFASPDAPAACLRATPETRAQRLTLQNGSIRAVDIPELLP